MSHLFPFVVGHQGVYLFVLSLLHGLVNVAEDVPAAFPSLPHLLSLFTVLCKKNYMIDHHPPKAARMCRVSGHQAAERGGEESA